MELVVILVLALVVLGPQRIPEVASSLGKAIRGFRKATRELRDQIDIEDEVRRPFEDLHAALRDEPPRHRPPPPLLTTATGDHNFPSVPLDPNFVPAGHGPVGAPLFAGTGAAAEAVAGGQGHDPAHDAHGHGPEPGHAAEPLAAAPPAPAGLGAAPPAAASLIAPPAEPVVRSSAGSEPWAAQHAPDKGVS